MKSKKYLLFLFLVEGTAALLVAFIAAAFWSHYEAPFLRSLVLLTIGYIIGMGAEVILAAFRRDEKMNFILRNR